MSDGPTDDSLLSTSDLSVGETLGLLSNDRRRAVLRSLSENGDVAFDSLVDTVVALETDGESADDRHQAVSMSLHHSHLPRLRDAGVAEFDAQSDTIRYRPDERLEAFLDLIGRSY